MLKIKRVYDPPEVNDGKRVLVDRIWPRGLSKERAKIDLWLKDVAPDTELRKWFNHDPRKWNEFRKRYKKALQGNEELRRLRSEARKNTNITLLYAAKDTEHNNAEVLREVL